jgi:hypothetical protein
MHPAARGKGAEVEAEGDMASNGKYTLHRRALIVLGQLDPKEKAQALAALDRLADTPRDQWAPRRAKLFNPEKSFYLVRANPSLRLIVRATDGEPPEVMDVVRQETLDEFARMAAEERR